MRVRVTILLLIANIIVGFWLLKIEADVEYKPAIAAPLFPSDIKTISIEGPGTLPYTIERNPRGWRVTQPFQWEAGPAADYIIEQLRFLRTESGFTREEALANGNSLGNYGLDKPAARLTVRGSGEGEKPVVVEIGLVTSSAGDARVSLLTSDGRILPSTRKFYETLVVPPDSLRSNVVFEVEPFQTRNVAVRIPAALPGKPERQIRIKAVQLPIPDSPDTERIWQFEVPFEAEASLPLTDAAIARLASLRIVRFPARAEYAPAGNSTAHEIATQQRRLGLNPPLLRLTLESNELAQTLLVGARDPQSTPAAPARFARLDNNDTVFTIPENAVLDWRNADKRLREREFLRFHADQLSEITIYGTDKDKILLQRRSTSNAAATASATKPKSDAEAAAAGVVESPALSAAAALAEKHDVSDDFFADWNIPNFAGNAPSATLATDAAQMRKLISDTLRHIAAIPMLSGETAPEMEKYCVAFVSDSPSPKELATLGFNKPARRVELRFKDGSQKTLLLAAPIAKGTPWHALVKGKNHAIYSVENRIAEELSTQPAHYRNRLVSRITPETIVSALKITDLKNGATLFSIARPNADTPIDAAIAKLPEDERAPATALLRQLASLRARAFLPGSFTKELHHKHPFAQTPAEWQFRMDVSLRTPGIKDEEVRTLYLTPRLGGSLQIGGSPLRDCIFELEQPLVDALFPLSHVKSPTTAIPTVTPPPDLPPKPTK